MPLCCRLSILWHCLSSGLEWRLTFSSPVATAELSKFAGILSAAQHHLWIRNSWTGIPSPPLALFIVMLSKAHFFPVIDIYSFKVLVRKDGFYNFSFPKFTKDYFLAQDVIYPGDYLFTIKKKIVFYHFCVECPLNNTLSLFALLCYLRLVFSYLFSICMICPLV